MQEFIKEVGEQLVIGGHIIVHIVGIDPETNEVELGIEKPHDMPVYADGKAIALP